MFYRRLPPLYGKVDRRKKNGLDLTNNRDCIPRRDDKWPVNSLVREIFLPAPAQNSSNHRKILEIFTALSRSLKLAFVTRSRSAFNFFFFSWIFLPTAVEMMRRGQQNKATIWVWSFRDLGYFTGSRNDRARVYKHPPIYIYIFIFPLFLTKLRDDISGSSARNPKGRYTREKESATARGTLKFEPGAKFRLSFQASLDLILFADASFHPLLSSTPAHTFPTPAILFFSISHSTLFSFPF